MVVQVVELQVLMVMLMDQLVLVTQVIQILLKVIQVEMHQDLFQIHRNGLVVEVVDLVALVQMQLMLMVEQVDHRLQVQLQDHLLQELVVVEVVLLIFRVE
jgi:hypothetical protein